MFRRLHRQLTVVCALVTGVITTLLFTAALHISETGLKKNDYGVFLNNVSTCLSYIDKQLQISDEWLARMEFNYDFIIHLEDGDNPLLFSQLKKSPDRTALIERAKERSVDALEESIQESGRRQTTQRADFSIKTEGGTNCDVVSVIFQRKDNPLGVILIHSLEKQTQNIRNQRLLFITLDVGAILLLSVFAWFFTGRILRPVENNRQKQIQFVAAASHELRTPLSVIMTNTPLLADTERANRDTAIARISTETKRMTRLIGDMLALANADTGNWSIFPEPIEPDTLVLNVFETFEPKFKEREKHLCVSLPDESVPVCQWDAERIEQAISILLDNARTYTPEQSETLLKLEEKNGRIFISVIDNGPGIPDTEKESVFDRFHRVDSSRNRKEHFGLGLSIAAEIIRLHKGTITINDTPTGGATFVVALPVR